MKNLMKLVCNCIPNRLEIELGINLGYTNINIFLTYNDILLY